MMMKYRIQDANNWILDPEQNVLKHFDAIEEILKRYPTLPSFIKTVGKRNWGFMGENKQLYWGTNKDFEELYAIYQDK